MAGPGAEVTEFYERYIAAFNAGDRAAFGACFHPPVTIVHSPRYDERRAGRALAVVDDAEALLAPLPPHWKRSEITELTTVGDAVPFAASEGIAEGLVERDDRRVVIVATATRFDTDDRAYQRIQALYVLTREEGRLGIKVLAELARADLAS
jgi:hypothetical protein